MGGGNQRNQNSGRRRAGLSPRGRGKPDSRRLGRKAARSIPAWAGETARLFGIRALRAVYPRVGGGNQPIRLRGARRDGLSPRGRGKPDALIDRRTPLRSIPAWAGETPPTILDMIARTVYPRVGGGNRARRRHNRLRRGLSPRGRGKRRCANDYALSSGSIPAWAGETRSRSTRPYKATVYPRVGGGNEPI